MIPPHGGTCLCEDLNDLFKQYTETNKPEEVKTRQAERAKYPDAKQIKK
jgi:hypothetical protein